MNTPDPQNTLSPYLQELKTRFFSTRVLGNLCLGYRKIDSFYKTPIRTGVEYWRAAREAMGREFEKEVAKVAA